MALFHGCSASLSWLLCFSLSHTVLLSLTGAVLISHTAAVRVSLMTVVLLSLTAGVSPSFDPFLLFRIEDPHAQAADNPYWSCRHDGLSHAKSLLVV